MKTPHDDSPCCPAASTATLAAVLHRYLEHLDRTQRHPDLTLLRSAAMELQARLDCKAERRQALQRMREWLEWDAPLFELSPPAAPAARGDDSR